MKKFFKRILATVLTVVMLFGIVPLGGFNLATKASAVSKTIENCKMGDYIKFGSYPQSKVTDETTISALTAAAGSTDDWISYGYYSGTGVFDDGKMEPSDFMKYKDITYNGKEYRGVYFTFYRPPTTETELTVIGYNRQFERGYYTDTIYWFEYEPLIWRILDPSEGFVMCSKTIDSQAFQNIVYSDGREAYHEYQSYDFIERFNSTDCTNYASDWSTSSIREWLNDSFYNTAFSAYERLQINTSYIENKDISGYIYPNSVYNGISTYDKIFLLSYHEDILNPSYGFSADNYTKDVARQLIATDYALCQGCAGFEDAPYYSTWNLRTSWHTVGIVYVGPEGDYYPNSAHSVNSCNDGVVPAFKLNPETIVTIEPHTHSYTSYVSKEATCTEDGVKTYKCSCGDMYTEIIKATGHDMVYLESNPTCISDGASMYVCQDCGYMDFSTYKVIPRIADAHTWGEWEVLYNANEKMRGSKHRFCTVCGKEEIAFIPAGYEEHKHTFEICEMRYPTCTDDGIYEYWCDCGESYTETVPKLGGEHKFSDWQTEVEPTETTGGLKFRVCEKCDFIEMESIPATGGAHTHSYTSSVTKSATCTENGVKTYTCSCGDSYIETIKATGHNYTAAITAPTCTEQGYTTHKCSKCGDSYKDTYVSAKGHSFGSWITEKEPTATADGSKYRVCSVCKYKETAVIPATGVHTHTLSHIVVPATCTVNGIEYDICTDCGETFNTVVIPAAHKYKHVAEESTCTKAGTEYDICTVCGAKANVKTLPLKAHSYEHITIPSTCTVAGMEYDICSECGKTINSKTLPLAAHTWGEWVRTKEPTVNAEGLEERECTVCHAKETRAVEKLKALIDESTGVQVVYDDEYSDGVKLEVEETFDGTSFQLVNANYGNVNTAMFDITTTKNGEKVQPAGKVTVRIPVPEGFNGGKIFAVYVDSVNGKTESIPATVVDGYVEFTVEHFSKYALCWEKGSVKSVSIGGDLNLKYKDTAKLNPVINADSGVKYKVEYKSSDNKIATVDSNGNVYGAKAWGKKTAAITCTVTDEYGNVVTDTCNVTCGYAWWQWIIGIVLFGWIWY